MTSPNEDKNNPSEPRKPIQKPELQLPEGALSEFLTFQRFATPVLVQIGFWVGVLIFLAVGLSTIESADRGWQGTSTALVWTGLLTMFLGPLVLRIVGELILVVFRINEQLGELSKRRP